MHQAFKWRFIAPLHDKESFLNYDEVVRWIEEQIVADAYVRLYRFTDGHTKELYYTDRCLEDLNEQAKAVTDGTWWWEEISE